jgi:hypothetical protein
MEMAIQLQVQNGSVTKIHSPHYHHLEILKKLTTVVTLQNDEREISAGTIQKCQHLNTLVH